MSKSFPSEDDLSGAAFSLADLQGAYRLNVSQLARGYVQISGISFVSVRGMNGIYIHVFLFCISNVSPRSVVYFPLAVSILARDCLFVGKHAFNKGLYDQAVQWISIAAELARSESNRTTSIGEIEPFLSTAIRVVRSVMMPFLLINIYSLINATINYKEMCLSFFTFKHDEVLERKGPIGENWRTNLEPFDHRRRAKSLRRSKQQQTQRVIDNPLGGLGTNKLLLSESEELEVFFKLCRGEGLRVLSSYWPTSLYHIN